MTINVLADSTERFGVLIAYVFNFHGSDPSVLGDCTILEAGTCGCLALVADDATFLSTIPLCTLPYAQAPLEAQTHWKQTALYLAEPLLLDKGDSISGKVHCHRRKDFSRHLDILLEYAMTKAGAAAAGQTKFQNFELC